jgi:flavin-dependent dehydrogenase
MAGVFQCDVFQQSVFQNDCSSAAADVVTGNNSAGDYAKAWDDHWKAKEKRDKRRAELLALIRSSDDYKRLQRKLRMFHEHLLDDPKSWRVKEKIAEIEEQIEMMERL